MNPSILFCIQHTLKSQFKEKSCIVLGLILLPWERNQNSLAQPFHKEIFNSSPKLLEVLASYTAQILASSPLRSVAYFISLCGQCSKHIFEGRRVKGTLSHFIYPPRNTWRSAYTGSQEILLSSWLNKLTDPISEQTTCYLKLFSISLF